MSDGHLEVCLVGAGPRGLSQQRQLARAIKNAREMALLPYGTK